MAQGRTAEIYAWEDHQILKLYRDWCPPNWVDYESQIASAVYEAGIPSPQPGGIVEVNGRRGLLYEHLEGISMLEDMNARPWRMLKHARALAELHTAIHRKCIGGLPSYKDRLCYDVGHAPQLAEPLREKVLAMLDLLPEGQNVCHGDFHPGNVMLTRNGPIVIDWMTACSGNPWTDVARTCLLLTTGAKAAGKQIHPFVRLAIRLYHHTYLQRYLALHDPGAEQWKDWMPIIAAGRLNENIAAEYEALLETVIHTLHQVDSAK